ncbi:hypothetical protein ACFVZC_17305 [Streptomyces marokkonensis]|uniref:Uncharacterized protein n=1 Tax=Streptomyces marokkonensis TaxID=324855 RepID=A0ABW6Q7G8_9ACTN
MQHARLTEAAENLRTTSQRPVAVTIEEYDQTRAGNWLARIRCPYCKRTHVHGAGSEAQPNGAGDRVPHCTDEYARLMPNYVLCAPGADDSSERERASHLMASLRAEHQRLILAERTAHRDAARALSAEIRAMTRGTRESANQAYVSAIRGAYGEAGK